MFKRGLLTVLMVVMGLIVVSSPLQAGSADAHQASIKKIQDYMNNLHMAKARFVQTASNGMQLVGTFYLSRPGKLRFEYDDPIDDFVVADGRFIYFYDSELEEQMNVPIGQSLADFVLRDHINFSGDVTVSDVRRDQGLLQLTLVQTEDPDAGSIAFAFSEKPFVLRKWRVTDAQNLVTEVELFYLETDVDLNPDLFVYTKPGFGQREHYND